MNGFLRISRRLFKHWIWESDEPFCKRAAWIDLCQRAAWEAHKKQINGKPLVLERGDLAASVRYLAKAWNWKPAKVQRFLKSLVNDTMITTRTDTGITIITISNYKRYNPFNEDIDTPPDTPIGTGPIHQRYTSDTPAIHQRYKIKEEKEYKEEKEKRKKSEEKSGIPLHAQAANNVINYFENDETGKEGLKWICAAARFSGDWRKVVRELYMRKSDAEQILRAAIRNPARHVGWIQSDMQRKTGENANTKPKKAFADQTQRIRAKYGT